MQTINWNLLSSAVAEVLFNISVATLVVTIFGMLALKFFVRPVPLLSHAIIFFWAMFRVLLVVSVVTFGVVLAGIQIPSAFSGLFSLAGLWAVGWLINRDLQKRYGVPTKFPSAGFKVVLSLFVLCWIFVGAYFLLTLWH